MDELPLHKDFRVSERMGGGTNGLDLSVTHKLSTAYKLWHKALADIPRIDRYSLGEKISLLFTELIELVLTARYVSKENKLTIVKKASLKLDVLKFFLQLVWEMKAIDNKKFADISAALFGSRQNDWWLAKAADQITFKDSCEHQRTTSCHSSCCRCGCSSRCACRSTC